MAMTPGEQPRIGREVAATRKSRTRNWPAQSTVYDRIESLANYSVSIAGQFRGAGKGMTAGRNFLAYFNDKDDKPRLKYNIQTEHGRPKKLYPKYPHPSKNIIPVGTSLDEICQYYPLHVWSDGLRIFMAENWTAEKIFKLLPEDTRNDGAAARPWNYLQQAMGREADKMYEEDDHGPRIVTKRKRDDTESNEEVQNSNTAMPVEKRLRLTPQGANLPHQQPIAVAPQSIAAPQVPFADDDGFDWSTSAYQPADMVAATSDQFDFSQPMMPAMSEFPARQQVSFGYNTDTDSSWSSASNSNILPNTYIPSVAYNESSEYVQSHQTNEAVVQEPVPSAAQDVVGNKSPQEVVENNTQDNNADADNDDDEDNGSEDSYDSSGEEDDESSLDGNEYDDSDEETASNDDAFTAIEHGVADDSAYDNPSGFIQDTLLGPIENTTNVFAPQLEHIASQIALYLESFAALSEGSTAYANMGEDLTAYFAEPQYYQAHHDYVAVDPYAMMTPPQEAIAVMTPQQESYAMMTPQQDSYAVMMPQQDSYAMMMPQQEFYGEIMPYGGYDDCYFN